MAWALWLDDRHRAAKLHVHFDVFKGVPCHATVTDGNGNEKKELRAALHAERLYVIDRGYAEYQLFQDLGYKYRWTVELFFRWFKCILGCQQLLSTCHNGVAIQV